MFSRVALVAALLSWGTGLAFAQATASITGRITDQAGAVLPGVAVTVTNTATGASRNTITNAEGLYTVPALLAATYNIKVELSGFAAQTRPSVQLLTGTTLSVDFQMTVATV